MARVRAAGWLAGASAHFTPSLGECHMTPSSCKRGACRCCSMLAGPACTCPGDVNWARTAEGQTMEKNARQISSAGGGKRACPVSRNRSGVPGGQALAITGRRPPCAAAPRAAAQGPAAPQNLQPSSSRACSWVQQGHRSRLLERQPGSISTSWDSGPTQCSARPAAAAQQAKVTCAARLGGVRPRRRSTAAA